MTAQNLTLDWRGQSCPAPIINTAREVRKLAGSPATLRIMSDDAAFPMDMRSWCKSSGAQLSELQEQPGGIYVAVVSVNESGAKPARPIHAKPPTPTTPAPQAGATTPRSFVDCRGQQCPGPVLAMAKAIRGVVAGQELEVWADDPAFPMDARSWCNSAKATLVSLDDKGGYWSAVVAKRAVPVIVSSSPKLAVASRPATSGPADIQGHSISIAGLDADMRSARLDAFSNPAFAGTLLTIHGDQDGFSGTVMGWAQRGGHELLSLETGSEPCMARVTIGSAGAGALTASSTALVPVNTDAFSPNDAVLLVLSNDLEKLLAAMMVATGAAAGGMKVTIFFSFWGINLLRGSKSNPAAIDVGPSPNIFQRFFKFLMPKGPRHQKLGKFNFAGAGTGIMQGIMKDRSIMPLEEMVETAVEQDITFIACTTSMSVMGLNKSDIADMPNIVYGGVATFVDEARGAGLSLVF